MYEQCMSNVCAMYAQCMCNVCTMYGQCMHNVWAMYAQCIINICAMYVQYMRNECTSMYKIGMYNKEKPLKKKNHLDCGSGGQVVSMLESL